MSETSTFIEPLFWELESPDTFGESQYRAVLFDASAIWITPDLSQKRAQTIAASATDSTQVTELLKDGRGERIERSSITRIEWAPERHAVLIIRGDETTKLTFSTLADTNTLGTALAGHLLPEVAIDSRTVGNTKKQRTFAHPIPKAAVVALFAILLDAVAKENYVGTGRRAALKETINRVMLVVPSVVVWLVALVALAAAVQYHRTTTTTPSGPPFELFSADKEPPPAAAGSD